MTARRKRALEAFAETERATEAAFLDMGAAELAWCRPNWRTDTMNRTNASRTCVARGRVPETS